MRMLIETTCPICQSNEDIEVGAADYHSWQAGKLSQQAFPYLSATKREQIQTGICGPCWDASFGED